MNKIGCIVLLIIVSACSPELLINSDKDSEANFAVYKSYAWSDDSESDIDKSKNYNDPQYDNELNRKRLKKAINLEMNKLGFTLDDNNSDLLVDYHIIIKNKHDYAVNTFGEHQFGNSDQVIVYNYDEGTLVIHLVDREKNELVWQGSASRVLGKQYKNVEDRINKVVSKIFERYPSSSE